MILTRRIFNGAALAAALVTGGLLSSAWANNTQCRSRQTAFKAAQASGSPDPGEIHAQWCPTCKAQNPILQKLTADPKFKDLKISASISTR